MDMRNTKIFIIVACLIVVLLLLCGCGEQSNENSTGISANNEVSETVSGTETSTSEASTESSKEISEEISDEASKEVSEEVSETVSGAETSTGEVSMESSEEVSEEISDEASKEVSEEVSNNEESVPVDHTHSYSKRVIPPTCTKKGCELYTCSCGDIFTVDIPITTHSYSEPTCTSPAKCDCGAIGAPSLGHSFSEGQCYRCGISDPNYVPPSNDSEKYTNGLSLGECMWGDGYSVWGIGTATDTDIIIPSTYNGRPVIEIYENAFKDCTNIKSVSIPSSVLTIGTNAFSGCTSLDTISIPEGLTTISSNAFYNCDSLKQVNIPNSIESIYKDSFADCDNLKYNEYSNGLYLGNQSNLYVALITAKSCEELLINNKTIIIAHNALSNNLVIKQVVVSDSVRLIGRNAFLGCKNLTNITFGEGLERIHIYAFKNCTSLNSAVFSQNHAWRVAKSGYGSGMTTILTNDASSNANNLKDKYCEYFWGNELVPEVFKQCKSCAYTQDANNSNCAKCGIPNWYRRW